MTPASSVLPKRVLFILLALALVLPALQAQLPFVPVRPLDGYFERPPRPNLTWESLKNNTYQVQLERYLEDQLGFRELFIRLRNQLDFSLYGVVHVNDVLVGENNVLFQGGPTESYLGRDFLGEDEVKFHARRVKRVQDDLAQLGVQFLYVLAPGKPGFLPEYLPEAVRETPLRATNYAAFSKELPAAGVNVLDASQLFRQWKATSPHPLFPRGGTHWSGYGVARVADTLFLRMEQMGRFDLPDFQTAPGVVTSQDLRFTNNDIASSLNVFVGPKPYPMAYPVITFKTPQPSQKRPNVLLIGDSFTQSFYGFYPYLSELFDARSRFWYYNQKVYWPENLAGENPNVHELDLREQLESRDFILLVTTEQNLSQRSFGFVNEVFNLLHPYTAADSIQVRNYENYIQSAPDWMAKVTQQAKQQGTSVAEALHREAVYMHERER